MHFWHLIFFVFCFVYKIESGKIRPNFHEIFGEEWDKKENGSETNDQMQNYQILTKSDQNLKEKPNDQQKKEIIQKFEAIKEKLKQKGIYQWKNNNKIETKIGKLLGANRPKIYKWKKEMNLNKIKMMKKSFYVEKKKEFIERFDEFKNLYGQRKQKEFVKELGISNDTFWKWKKELLPKFNKTQHFNDEKLRKKMKQYFEIKEANPKINDEIISKKLGIGRATLIRWKKKFVTILEK